MKDGGSDWLAPGSCGSSLRWHWQRQRPERLRGSRSPIWPGPARGWTGSTRLVESGPEQRAPMRLAPGRGDNSPRSNLEAQGGARDKNKRRVRAQIQPRDPWLPLRRATAGPAIQTDPRPNRAAPRHRAQTCAAAPHRYWQALGLNPFPPRNHGATQRPANPAG